MNGDFYVKEQHDGGIEKVFADAELALLDRYSCQTQQELSGLLGVTQQAIAKRLKAMRIKLGAVRVEAEIC